MLIDYRKTKILKATEKYAFIKWLKQAMQKMINAEKIAYVIDFSSKLGKSSHLYKPQNRQYQCFKDNLVKIIFYQNITKYATLLSSF